MIKSVLIFIILSVLVQMVVNAGNIRIRRGTAILKDPFKDGRPFQPDLCRGLLFFQETFVFQDPAAAGAAPVLTVPQSDVVSCVRQIRLYGGKYGTFNGTDCVLYTDPGEGGCTDTPSRVYSVLTPKDGSKVFLSCINCILWNHQNTTSSATTPAASTTVSETTPAPQP